MKPNEAPEKIYINDFGSELSYDWHTEHCCENDIEYIRKDAFIEKALRWMISQGGVNDALSREMIEDFKNYMKGE